MRETLELIPIENELPTHFAERVGLYFASLTEQTAKKAKGQFFTPIDIAKFMGKLSHTEKTDISILDPGCGLCILSCAIVQAQVDSNHNLENIKLVAYETDKGILPLANVVLEYLKNWVTNKGIEFNFHINTENFVEVNYKALYKPGANFDIIITNPPYFKLSKEDPLVSFCNILVSGQPNIYALFLGIASALLKEHGELISITPRSFSSGKYFQAFRNYFFSKLSLDFVHLFDSRRDTFNKDKVLQEVVIMRCKKETKMQEGKVIISSSAGTYDLSTAPFKIHSSKEILDYKSDQKVLHIPINLSEEKILNLVLTWQNKLADLNINISTGPVVSFRAKQFLDLVFNKDYDNSCPMIRLHNVNKMTLIYPLKNKDKSDKILITKESKSILLPNKDYVLLRRFSTKDDSSRLIAAPYFSSTSHSPYLGIDNAVNYIYRKNGNLCYNEIIGLCGLLNSEVFDTYFKIFNGNVNVSATELREMRFPDIEVIKDIGVQISSIPDINMTKVNSIISDTLFFYVTEKI